MPPKKAKGKGKGKKGKKDEKKDPNKLSNVDRAFCELTIADLNQKLARLRSHLASLDDNNINLKEKLREIEEDHTDVAAHLERTLGERNETIYELEERLTEIIKIREAENVQSAERIKELESKYKSMHDQLTSEIKLLNGKLNSLDEFRVQRDLLLSKFDDQETELKEKERAHTEMIYAMEQKAVVEKDALKKEVETKLLQVSEDFTRSSEIRNAGYTRRLIRENIALQKEIDILVLSQIKMQQQFNEQVARHKEMTEQYASMDQLKKQLIRNSQNKIKIIEKLTDNYERLKEKYVEVAKYRKLYENAVERDICDSFNFKDMSKKMRHLEQRIEELKMDKSRLIAVHQEHETEIQRLRDIVAQIKATVRSAVDIDKPAHKDVDKDGVKETPSQEALRQLRRHDLLAELMDIVSTHTDKLPPTPSVITISRSIPSVYSLGKMGFMPRSASTLMEIFKRAAHKAISADAVATEYQVQQVESKIIPKARELGGENLFDVEMGSTLYVSSSHEAIETMVPVEDEQVEDEDEGESSSADYGSSQARTTAKQSVISALPPQVAAAAKASADISERMSVRSARSVRRSEIGESATPRVSERASRAIYDVEYDEGDEEFSINLFY
ncbi:cilia- and flagella-associated protein 157 [Ceratitis capitata]|uniref:cilia- and flagella-associated protein 157 n=1 Tax=Ceratitis capitata TaxID=7213 RepID=UPI00061892DA|nr:cilia- and flagella-associated protein 157 [Ceratitis capitata]